MTVLGLGNDIIEIERIRKAVSTHKKAFLLRLFTEKELAYCEEQKDPFPRYAGRFAAKEAIVKALGCGFGKDVEWHDMEILPNEKGMPIVFFSERLKNQFNNPQILISISHCKTYASAVALLLK